MIRKLHLGWILLTAILMISVLAACGQKDTPPTLALNGTELNLASLKVSDMNNAGFYLTDNAGSMTGDTFRERLSYVQGEDGEMSMGGISLLNRSSGSKDYVDCEVFEIYAKSRDREEGNSTGLKATYNGQEFFGKTKDELIGLFGEPSKESVSYLLVYTSENKYYTTTFHFDTKTDDCYLVEVNRYEKGLVR